MQPMTFRHHPHHLLRDHHYLDGKRISTVILAILPILPRFLLFAVIASWKCPLLKIVLLQENLQKLAAAVAEIEERDATQIEWEIKAEEI